MKPTAAKDRSRAGEQWRKKALQQLAVRCTPILAHDFKVTRCFFHEQAYVPMRGGVCTGVIQNTGLSLPVLWGEQAVLRDPSREDVVQQCGMPCTIVRTGRVKDIPGRKAKLEISQDTQNAQDIR